MKVKTRNKKIVDVIYTCKCNSCLKNFEANTPAIKYCSNECRAEYQRKKKELKNLCKCGCGELCKGSYKWGHNGKHITKETHPEKGRKISKWRKEHPEITHPQAIRFGKWHTGKISWKSGLTKETDARVANAAKSIKKLYDEQRHPMQFDDSLKKKRSNSLKKTLKEHPEIIQKMCSSDLTKPNRFENKFIEVINENKLPLKWVGNGKFWITFNGKNHNPDFIAEKPINLVIEVFANFFKLRNFGSIKSYLKYRKEAFNARGFKILFFNENSLVNKQKVLNKLQRHLSKFALKM